MLLLWPAYVVGWGIIVGYVGAKLAGTPKSQLRSVLAACAFSNSTGLPITLLTVVHTNFPDTTELGRIDPTLFLSVYLLTYPMLQWSIGGWLLAPEDEEDQIEEEEQQQQLAKILEDEQHQMEYGGIPEQVIPIDDGTTPNSNDRHRLHSSTMS
jgi:predicted permease